MAQLPKFDAQAPRRPSLPVPTDTGAADTWRAIAAGAGQITDQLLNKAARLRKQEALDDADRVAPAVDMPGVDFAYKPGSPKAAPSLQHMPGDIRAIVSAAAQRHGVDPNALLRTAMLESSGNPKAKNPNSSAGGLFQFIDSTARQYGLADRFDPAQSADAAARLMKDNAAHLRRVLGREPTPGELYLAHQQGAGGAAKLLANPNASASSLVGADAVRLNGGQEGMTAAAFAGLWTGKFGGGSGPGTVSVKLTGAAGPVPRAASGTIYGDTFNARAAQIYENRLEAGMRAQMDALALQHPDDPAALDEALEALRSGYLAELPPEMKASVGLTFEREKLGHTLAAARRLDDRVRSENLAAFEESHELRLTSAARLAARAGAGDEETNKRTDAALAAELDAIWRAIDAAPLTPLEKGRRMRAARGEVFSARILGGFDNLEEPAERAEYVRAFQDEWKKGDGFGGKLDADTFERVNAELIRRAKADEVEAGKRVAALDKGIEQQLGFLKKGFAVGADVRREMAAQVARTGDEALAQRLSFLDGLAEWQRAHVAERPGVIDAQIAQLRARIAEEGATEAALVSLDVMETLAKEMRSGLATDPLTWATRAGVAQVAPLDFADGPRLTASLAERTADARAVAGHYGVEPKFFTPAEADALKKVLSETPLALPSLASSLAAGLGEDAPAALAEISKDAPILAHIGGLVAATGDQRLAVEAAEALELRRQPGYKSILPSDGKLRSTASAALGGALGAQPEVFGQVIETAAAVFERRAMMRGLALDDFATDDAPGRELFLTVLDETLGARTIGGVKHGGLTEVNGFATIAPPDLAADSLQEMMLELSDDDLLFQEGIGTANGVRIDAARIRAGRLVRQADGRYLVALGDVEGGEPLFVPDAADGLFELDVRMLARAQDRQGFEGWSRRIGGRAPGWRPDGPGG